MRNRGGIRLFIQAALIGVSTDLIVEMGITELVTLIFLFCGLLHMTWGLGEERNEETQSDSGSRSGARGLTEEQQSQEDVEHTRHKGGADKLCIGCRRELQLLEYQGERTVERREEHQEAEGWRRSGIDKRKNGKFYAVLRGRHPAIYTS